MKWKRPDSAPFPSVWATFQGKPHGDEEPLEYKIQDLTDDYAEAAIQHMLRYFLIRENTCATTGFIEQQDSVDDIVDLWRSVVKQRMALICLAIDPKSGAETIAGLNMTCIVHKDDDKSTNWWAVYIRTHAAKHKLPRQLIDIANNLRSIYGDNNEKFKGELMNRVWNCLTYLQSPVDVFKIYNADVYMSALGLSVAPQNHGDNIGYELLMARTPLCKAAGVPLTVTAFTGEASQHLATKTGFHKIAGFKYQDYKPNGKIAYPRLDTDVALMAKEFNNNVKM